jgi:hypothetical protein
MTSCVVALLILLKYEVLNDELSDARPQWPLSQDVQSSLRASQIQFGRLSKMLVDKLPPLRVGLTHTSLGSVICLKDNHLKNGLWQLVQVVFPLVKKV